MPHHILYSSTAQTIFTVFSDILQAQTEMHCLPLVQIYELQCNRLGKRITQASQYCQGSYPFHTAALLLALTNLPLAFVPPEEMRRVHRLLYFGSVRGGLDHKFGCTEIKG